MLRALSVRGFALLAEVEVAFGPGLNVMTGETGAGKSLVVDALQFVLGGRATSEVVRAGERAAHVEACFDLPPPRDGEADGEEPGRNAGGATPFPVGASSEAAPGDGADGEVLLSRGLGADGRGVSRCDGHLCTVTMLRRWGERLVDMCGQGDQQWLLRPARQLTLLDAFAGPPALAPQARRHTLLAERAAIEDELASLREDPRQVDFLTAALGEIEAARPRPDEDAELRARRSVLQHAERLFAGVSEAYQSLRAREAHAGRLDELAALDERLRPAADLCRESEVAAAEAAALLRRYRDGLEFEPGELERLEARLAQLAALRRRYGDDLTGARERLRAELDALSDLDARRVRLQERARSLAAEIAAVTSELVAARNTAGARLAAALTRELAPLAMPEARLEVAVGQDGERSEFLLAANPGEPSLPLQRAASGGELARCLLALKVCLLGADPMPTLVFDEIDAGIGGRAAEAVAERLRRLAAGHQVICVTHQASIAAAADTHLEIAKESRGGRARTVVRPLSGAARALEVARMLSGDAGPAALRHAEDLLRRFKTAG